MQITINDIPFHFEVQFSKRSKINLDISQDGYLTLKVPKNTSEHEINTYMQSRASDLLKLHQQLENRKYITSEKTYHQEELFLYFGQAYPLSQLLGESLESEEEMQRQLQKFYTKKTKQYIKKRLPYFEKQLGVKVKSMTIVDSPKTWGTCSSLKELTFNYKLSMAPQSVIDYVIIHELCHIFHLNHDRSFWRKIVHFGVK